MKEFIDQKIQIYEDGLKDSDSHILKENIVDENVDT